MRTRPLFFLATATLSVFLLNVCSEESTDIKTSQSAVNKQAEELTHKAKPATTGTIQADGIMGQAVNFSTPEDIEKSLQSIEDETGAAVANQIRNAIDYLLVYDLSVNRDKAKLYKKLDGKTPNEILAMAN